MRSRSITIYAESKDDYSNQLDQEIERKEMHCNRLGRKALHFEEKDDMQYSSLSAYYFDGQIISEDEDEHATSSSEEEGEEIIQHLHKVNQSIYSTYQTQQAGIDLLCMYLKNSINCSFSLKNEGLFYKSKNQLYSLSGNAIYDINIHQLIDEIINETISDGKNGDDNEKEEEYADAEEEGSNSNCNRKTNRSYKNHTKDNSCYYDENDSLSVPSHKKYNSNDNNKTISQNSLRDLILQNIPQEATVKFMLISNNSIMKNSLFQLYFNHKDLSSSSFEIRHKIVKLFNKIFSIQIFDTEPKFHHDLTSQAYYKVTDAFIMLIDASQPNCIKFLNVNIERIKQISNAKTIVLIANNLFYEPYCTVDGENLKEYANANDMLFIPKEDLKLTYESNKVTLRNILSFVVVTKVERTVSSNTRHTKILNTSILRKNNLGYNKAYRLEKYSQIDYDCKYIDSSAFYRKINRRWSKDN